MLTTTRSSKKTDTYMDLILRLPLKPIRNDRQHEAAVELVGQLMGTKLDDGASAYLDTLILLINKYEDEHHTPGGMDLTPREALRAIMTANQMTQADIGRIIGSETAVSMFLRGQRELSKAHIKALADRFRIDASLFL